MTHRCPDCIPPDTCPKYEAVVCDRADDCNNSGPVDGSGCSFDAMEAAHVNERLDQMRLDRDDLEPDRYDEELTGWEK